MASGKAQPYRPELGTKPKVYYVGLQAYTKELLSSSIVLKDKEEYSRGAKVTLTDKKIATVEAK